MPLKMFYHRLRRRWWRWLLWIFAFMNLLAIFQAYSFTHFSATSSAKISEMTFGQKLWGAFFGISRARASNYRLPQGDYETVLLQSNRQIECWHIRQPNAGDTVALFHGYGASKSSLLDKAERFRDMGYSVLLVDFMGAGGSQGNQTTLGYAESEQVQSCIDYLNTSGEKNVYLFGTSMGAVAIMKAVSEGAKPSGIILECPFGTLYEAVRVRFSNAGVPSFPMVALIVFWGGLINGFWAFGHAPSEYARNINCPTLLLYGAADEKVNRTEIDTIFARLPALKKRLSVYPQAAHDDYLRLHAADWQADVAAFLNDSQ